MSQKQRREISEAEKKVAEEAKLRGQGPAMAQQATPISGDDKRRAEECMQAFNLVLQKYDCIAVPIVQIAGNSIQSNIVIQPRPRLTPEQEADLKQHMQDQRPDQEDL